MWESPLAAEDNEQRIERGRPDLYVLLFGIRIALNGGYRELGPAIEGPKGPDAADLDLDQRSMSASPAGRSTRTIERQAPRYRLDLPWGDDIAPAVRARRRRRQPHVDREARQAARAPPRPRLPTLGMRRREDERADQPLVAHDAVPCRQSTAFDPSFTPAGPLYSLSCTRSPNGYAERTNQVVSFAVGLSGEAYGP